MHHCTTAFLFAALLACVQAQCLYTTQPVTMGNIAATQISNLTVDSTNANGAIVNQHILEVPGSTTYSVQYTISGDSPNALCKYSVLAYALSGVYKATVTFVSAISIQSF
jgi:hypothetical protein